jgi:hypothetical protein
MREISIVLISLLLFCGCKEKPAQKKESSSSNANLTWADSLIIGYINQTDNEVIKAARKDSIPVEWMFDRAENTDSAKYFVFQLGHSFENKYITDSWLYIDSMTKSVNEYDIARDSLIKWRK